MQIAIWNVRTSLTPKVYPFHLASSRNLVEENTLWLTVDIWKCAFYKTYKDTWDLFLEEEVAYTGEKRQEKGLFQRRQSSRRGLLYDNL